MKPIHFTHDVHMFAIFWIASNQKLTIKLLAMLQKCKAGVMAKCWHITTSFAVQNKPQTVTICI